MRGKACLQCAYVLWFGLRVWPISGYTYTWAFWRKALEYRQARGAAQLVSRQTKPSNRIYGTTDHSYTNHTVTVTSTDDDPPSNSSKSSIKPTALNLKSKIKTSIKPPTSNLKGEINKNNYSINLIKIPSCLLFSPCFTVKSGTRVVQRESCLFCKKRLSILWKSQLNWAHVECTVTTLIYLTHRTSY